MVDWILTRGAMKPGPVTLKLYLMLQAVRTPRPLSFQSLCYYYSETGTSINDDL